MDIDEFQHYSELLTQHVKNLRKLEVRLAKFGFSNIPLSLQNEIELEQQEISRLQKIVAAFTHQDAFDEKYNVENQEELSDQSYYEHDVDDEYNTLVLLRAKILNTISENKGTIITIVIVGLVLSIIAYNMDKYQETIKLQDDFQYSQGLGAWKSVGVVSVVDDDGHGVVTSTDTLTHTTINSGSVGAVRIIASGLVKIYNVVPGIAAKGKIYRAEAWCKAPIGATCIMFLGVQSDGLSFQSPTDYRSMSRSGNGEWQSMILSYELDKDENLSLFLYAQGQSQPVLFDDVLVRVTN